MAQRKAARPAMRVATFAVSSLAAALDRTGTVYQRGEAIFVQGDAGHDVRYIQTGRVRLSVRSKMGQDAVVTVLGPGDFFGEECLAGQAVRPTSATAVVPSRILRLGARTMVELLRRQRAIADRFVAHLLTRHARIEEDWLDQLFDSSEKRLARVLLRRANYGGWGTPASNVAHISQARLATLTGTTRARVRVLLDRFKRLGYIECQAARPLTIHCSLLNVVLRD
jgi:CRP/FNR family cyclic AMP-dependent transcriptional regulator